MDGENNGNTQAQQIEQQQEGQTAQQQAASQQEAQGKHAKEASVDASARNGVDAAAYESQLAERDSRIAELEAQIAEASKNAETADGLRAEIAALKEQGESDRIDFRLQLAGCRNVKAARAVLGDHKGDMGATGPQGERGEPGDQTGSESLVRGYYEWWDGILHYNCGADDGEASGGGSGGAGAAGDLPMPRYRVAVMRNGSKRWLPWMRGMIDEGGSADTYAGEAGVGIVDIEFEGGSLGPNGWFTKNMSGDKLIGLTVYYDTPHPGDTSYWEAVYRVHWLGSTPSWGKWEHDDNDGGAGNDRDQIDMVELTIRAC